MSDGTYAFIYDDVVNDRRYERALADLDAKLTSLDIQGRVGHLTLFRSAKDLIESMVNQGVTTIVVVGNDHSLDKIMWFLPDMDVTLGYIPLAEPSAVAGMLGIPNGIGACEVLGARLIDTIDLGRIDDRHFLTEVTLPSTNATVDIEGRYRISAINGGSVTIRNLGGNRELADAQDGMLEVIITPNANQPASRRHRPEPSENSRILIRYGEIISTVPVDVRVDSHAVNGFRFKLGISPKKLKLITGRQRRLAPLQGLSKQSTIDTLPTATISVR